MTPSAASGRHARLHRERSLDPRRRDHDRGEARVRGEAAVVEPRVALLHGRPPPDHDAERAEAADRGEGPHAACRRPAGRDVAREDDGEERAHEQLGRARVGAVVHARRAVACVQHPARHDGRDDAGCEQRAEHLPAPQRRRAPRQPRDERHDEREHDVELLLDRERPEVQHRRRGAEEVRVALPRRVEAPVRDVREGGEHVAAQQPELVVRRDRRPEDQHAGQREHRGREQAPGPPAPEAAEGHAPFALGEQQARDQEARQREEGADPEEAAPGKAVLRVVEEHHGDREAAQPVECADARVCPDFRFAAHPHRYEGSRAADPRRK